MVCTQVVTLDRPLERTEVRHDLDEHLLGGVLRVGGVAEEAQREPVDRVLELPAELRERVGVPRRRPGDERRELVSGRFRLLPDLHDPDSRLRRAHAP